MTELQVVEWLKATFGPGAVIMGWYLSRALWRLGERLVPVIIEAIAEMKNLRSDMEVLKKLGPRVDKLEVDTHESFKRIRTLEKGGS